MKKLTKSIYAIFAFILVFTGSFMLTGCKNEKEPKSVSALDCLNETVEFYNSSILEPANATTELVYDLEDADSEFYLDEFDFMNISVLNEIQEVEKNGKIIEDYIEEIYNDVLNSK